jgi:hypothetical protein
MFNLSHSVDKAKGYELAILIGCLVVMWLSLIPNGVFLIAFGAWLPEAGTVLNFAFYLWLASVIATCLANRHAALPLAAGYTSLATRVVWSSKHTPQPFPTFEALFSGFATVFFLTSLRTRNISIKTSVAEIRN